MEAAVTVEAAGAGEAVPRRPLLLPREQTATAEVSVVGQDVLEDQRIDALRTHRDQLLLAVMALEERVTRLEGARATRDPSLELVVQARCEEADDGIPRVVSPPTRPLTVEVGVPWSEGVPPPRACAWCGFVFQPRDVRHIYHRQSCCTRAWKHAQQRSPQRHTT